MSLEALAEKYGDDDEDRAALLAATKRRLEYRARRGGKVCSRCSVQKPVSDFGPDARARDGLRSACRECESADIREKRV